MCSGGQDALKMKNEAFWQQDPVIGDTRSGEVRLQYCQ